MGTTVDKLALLANTKRSIKEAIIRRGAEVSDEDTFASYATMLDNIPTMYISQSLPETANEGDYCLLIEE